MAGGRQSGGVAVAVLVEFALPGATPERLAALDERIQERRAAAGGPPYPGLIFVAITPTDGGCRCVSAWRTEQDFRSVLEAMLEPDLSSAGLVASDVSSSPIMTMAMPGAHAH